MIFRARLSPPPASSVVSRAPAALQEFYRRSPSSSLTGSGGAPTSPSRRTPPAATTLKQQGRSESATAPLTARPRGDVSPNNRARRHSVDSGMMLRRSSTRQLSLGLAGKDTARLRDFLDSRRAAAGAKNGIIRARAPTEDANGPEVGADHDGILLDDVYQDAAGMLTDDDDINVDGDDDDSNGDDAMTEPDAKSDAFTVPTGSPLATMASMPPSDDELSFDGGHGGPPSPLASATGPMPFLHIGAATKTVARFESPPPPLHPSAATAYHYFDDGTGAAGGRRSRRGSEPAALVPGGTSDAAAAAALGASPYSSPSAAVVPGTPARSSQGNGTRRLLSRPQAAALARMTPIVHVTPAPTSAPLLFSGRPPLAPSALVPPAAYTDDSASSGGYSGSSLSSPSEGTPSGSSVSLAAAGKSLSLDVLASVASLNLQQLGGEPPRDAAPVAARPAASAPQFLPAPPLMATSPPLYHPYNSVGFATGASVHVTAGRGRQTPSPPPPPPSFYQPVPRHAHPSGYFAMP